MRGTATLHIYGSLVGCHRSYSYRVVFLSNIACANSVTRCSPEGDDECNQILYFEVVIPVSADSFRVPSGLVSFVFGKNMDPNSG